MDMRIRKARDGSLYAQVHSYPSRETSNTTMQAETEAALSGTRRNAHTPVFHEVPKLMETVREALEEHYVGRLTLWLLGLAIAGLIAAASVFFLALSPYLIAALSPFFQS